MDDTSRRTVLGQLLRSARARVRPESLGLDAHGKRRTRGLRREEVAELADISPKWYAQLETGVSTVSMRTLEPISDVLQLTVAERVELFRLARPEIDRIVGSDTQSQDPRQPWFSETSRRCERPRDANVQLALRKAALRLASTMEYSAVSFEAIASAVAVDPAELRQSYPSVADLYLHVLTAIGSEFRLPTTEQTQCTVIMKHALEVGRAFRSEIGNILRGLVSDAQCDGKFRDRFRDFIEQRRMALVFLIQRAVKCGELSKETARTCFVIASLGRCGIAC